MSDDTRASSSPLGVDGGERLEIERLDLAAHRKEWQRIAEQFSAQINPGFLNMAAAIQKIAEPALEAQRTFQKTAEQISASQKQWAKLIGAVQGLQGLPKIEIPRFDLPDFSSFAKHAETIRSSFSTAFAELQKSFQELPPRMQEALLLLGAHGWYFDLDMMFPQLWKLQEALSEGNVEGVEQALVDYFEGRVDEIEKSIVEIFPNRAHLIRAAFSAHRRQEYELSIPVLLAQTDGICKDATNQYFFLKRDKKPQTAIYVEQIVADTFRASLLSPLAQALPIAASEKERSGGSNALNRHAVLHGESLNYGTKANSLRAISLINYAAHALKVRVSG